MEQSILLTYDNLNSAFKKVDTVLTSENSTRLNGVLDIAMIGRVDSLWDAIVSAIKKTFIYGSEAIHDTIQSILSRVDDLMEKAKEEAKDVHNRLKLMIRTFIRGLVDEAFQLVPKVLSVAGTEFPLTKITYSQKISLGGSIKTNILSAIELTSNGELQVEVEYAKI